MDDECLWRAQDWPIPHKDLILRPRQGAAAFYRAARRESSRSRESGPVASTWTHDRVSAGRPPTASSPALRPPCRFPRPSSARTRKPASASASRASRASRRSSSVDSGSTDRTLGDRRGSCARAGLPIRLIHQDWLGYAAAEAVRPRSGARALGAQHRRRRVARRRPAARTCRGSSRPTPRSSGWRLRRTLTLYGRPEAGEPVDAARTHPAPRPARARALRRVAARPRGPDRRRPDGDRRARASCAMSAACRSTSR